jgi:hypothetical protein
MAKRSTIGSNPLDAVVPMGRPGPAAEAAPEPVAPRERVTVALPADLMERARNAVYWTPGATLTALVEDAIKLELAKREAEAGGPFQPRGTKLQPGRRMRN